MKILKIKSTVFPEVKVIKFAYFRDKRGFFTEIYRKNDFQKIDFLKDQEFVQCNASSSKKGVIRGLHFQWNPHVNKLIRVIKGNMIDLFLDIRLNSPTFGKIGAYELSGHEKADYNEWIWIPEGFAHGGFFKNASIIEYFCTAEYNPYAEASICPFASDIDWSLIEDKFRKFFKESTANDFLISEKDMKGFTLDKWSRDAKSKNFIYG